MRPLIENNSQKT